ncbi:MAG: MFS transporter [Acidobacteriota bacterium]|nr:MFS transporter [Acidobacteriota bacterium]
MNSNGNSLKSENNLPKNSDAQLTSPEINEETTSKLPAVLRAFRHRNYRLFFFGQLVSLSGTWMQSVAQSWLVYKLTGSAVLLGFVGFSNQIPVFLLASFGGAIADKYNRHRILIFTQTAAMILAFVLALLTLTNLIQIWHIFTIAALLGVANAFDIPTRQAFITDMVGREDLINAIALNSSMFNGARIVGPAIAGILVGAVGEGWAFLGNAISYIAVITGLLLMTIKIEKRAPVKGSALQNIAEGFSFVARTAPVRALLLLLGFVSLIGTPYSVLMPIFADQILTAGASGLGILMGASGVGALAGAITLAMRKSINGLGYWVALASVGFGASLILFSLSASFWLSALLLVPVGFFMMIQMASSNTLVQSMVPDELRGRVMAVYSMMFMGMAPFGALIAGSIASNLGAPLTVRIGGAVCILGALVFALRLPVLREEARQIIIGLRMNAGEPPEEVIGQTAVLAPKNS